MTKTRRVVEFILSFVVLLVTAGGILYWMEWPGGMRPNYPAKDYDARLTREARSAKPIIAALEEYHGKHGNYPEQGKDLLPFLSPDAVAGEYSVMGWNYSRNLRDPGYMLSRKLGWDTGLRYYCEPPRMHWVFGRSGERDSEVPIKLEL